MHNHHDEPLLPDIQAQPCDQKNASFMEIDTNILDQPIQVQTVLTQFPQRNEHGMHGMVEDLYPSVQANKAHLYTHEQVQYYTNWLTKQADYDTHHDYAQEIAAYRQEATKAVKVGKIKVATFAPFRAKLSALQTFTTSQIVILCSAGALCILGLLLFHLGMVAAIISAITIMYTFNLVLNIGIITKTFRHSPEEHISEDLVHALKDADWPMYTILCPLYREAQVVPQFVRAIQALDYPAAKLQILFLTEEEDIETRNAIRAMVLPEHFKILIVPDGQPRTKPRACNYGLLYATGSYVVIYDAEDIPDPLQLKKAVLTFANHGTDVVCVQAKLNFYNVRQNLLTRWFTAEYATWFDVMLPGFQLAGFSLPLGGTSNHFRTAGLRALGGWDAYNVTEDCDLGLRLKRYHMNTVIIDSTTLEEANSQVKNWIRQRSRWIKGYMQTYLVHMRHPFEYFRQGRFYDWFTFQIVVGHNTGVLLINPCMWILLGIYMFFGPSVVNVYHILFPGPMLYLGAFCLIFGNFFYVYLYLLACMKRKQYHLLIWTLFIPFYWLLMSIAAIYAIFELLVRPHYWQKTVHGLHLRKNLTVVVTVNEERIVEADCEEKQVTLEPVNPDAIMTPTPSVRASLNTMRTQPLPAISLAQKHAQQVAENSKVRDLWFVATLVTACITSLLACGHYLRQHQILLYNDAYSHMRIARSVFDSTTPGVAQLGGVWLPLPHLLMIPFIWSNTLWHTGLAGSFPAMFSYIAATTFLFLSIRRLTHDSGVSFVGTLAFLFNPNILYLQATPLSEMVCIWTLTMACYFFLVWVQDGGTNNLTITAASTFLATLSRYDGWSLFAVLLVLIIVVGVMKRQSRSEIQGNFLQFVVLGGFGIVLWLAWNKIIFGDPLYFQHSAYSSQASQYGFLQSGNLYAYHNVWIAIKTYTLNSMETFGSPLFIVAMLGFVVFFLRRRITVDMLAALAFATPFAMYVLSLYSGQAIIWVPGAVPANSSVQLFNVRYGSEMVLPAALFLAMLLAYMRSWLRSHPRAICQVIFLLAIIGQTLLITKTGIISLQDGEFGLSCAPTHTVNTYLAQHYNGGRILIDVTTGDYSVSESGLDFKHFVYDGSGTLWNKALTQPAKTVDWIIAARQSPYDRITKDIKLDSSTFRSQFTLVSQEADGISLYHRNGTPLPPVHPSPATILTEHRMCHIGTN